MKLLVLAALLASGLSFKAPSLSFVHPELSFTAANGKDGGKKKKDEEKEEDRALASSRILTSPIS